MPLLPPRITAPIGRCCWLFCYRVPHCSSASLFSCDDVDRAGEVRLAAAPWERNLRRLNILLRLDGYADKGNAGIIG